MVRTNEDGSKNICEVKSSTSVKDKSPHNHLKDAAFQTIAAENSGNTVSRIFLVHLNKDYVREGAVDPSQLLKFVDETVRVRELLDETQAEIASALELLAQQEIDETSCTCLKLGKARHCDSFNYFNPTIPDPSIYDLPRLHKNKIDQFSNEGRYSLNEIDPGQVSALQQLVLVAAQNNAPLVDESVIEEFYSNVKYPVYFLDYETYASAIPIVDGAKPQAPIPFQFSLHVKRTPDDLEHFEFLEEEPQLPKQFIERMEKLIGGVGTIVSWHMAFENTRNREMAQLFPEKAEFLNDITQRTVDLENLFKTGYVDIAFKGSTSIKKVLPVLAKDLDYAGMAVASGTDAMDAWLKLLKMPAGNDRKQLREDMLEYCKLDTYAMVRIFETMERLVSE